ncbi:MAG: flagellar hook-basal body complex protein FliE [Candidatus Lambdaproteobacteria bacterium]|nr:flagellar hook-basal body complex protein FliE [Candidatus Lambdaproteobacteria bacterium]
MDVLNATSVSALREHDSRRGGSGTLIDQLGKSFGDMLDEVNTLQAESDRKMEEFATSPDKDIHGTMIAMQKADIAMRLLLQVRGKLVNAYNEVMRMNF